MHARACSPAHSHTTHAQTYTNVQRKRPLKFPDKTEHTYIYTYIDTNWSQTQAHTHTHTWRRRQHVYNTVHKRAQKHKCTYTHAKGTRGVTVIAVENGLSDLISNLYEVVYVLLRDGKGMNLHLPPSLLRVNSYVQWVFSLGKATSLGERKTLNSNNLYSVWKIVFVTLSACGGGGG